MANEVATREAAVPALAATPASTLTAEDVALPRLYIGQYMSAAVQEQLVKAGSIYAALGKDDPEPTVLWTPEAKKNPGVVFYVVTLKKGKSFSEEGGDLELWDFDDPSADPRAWVTYTYLCLVPEFDVELPCKLLLTRSGKQTAQKINTVLRRTAVTGPSWITAFQLSTVLRENAKGKFYVAQVSTVDPNPDHVNIAGDLAIQLASSSQPSDYGSTGEAPAI